MIVPRTPANFCAMNTQSKWLNRISSWDIQLFCWCMERNCRPLLARTGRVISHTGDGYGYAIVAAALALSELETRGSFYWALALAFVIERGCYFVMKLGFRRNRPAAAIDDFNSWVQPSDQFSFPSGHTSGAFLFSGFMECLVPEYGSLFFGWACCVGLSRFFLGVHFITDVAMGAVMGFSLSQLTIYTLLE